LFLLQVQVPTTVIRLDSVSLFFLFKEKFLSFSGTVYQHDLDIDAPLSY